MKLYDCLRNHGLAISILVILASVALIGIVAAADLPAAAPGGWGNSTSHSAYYQNMTANRSAWNHGYVVSGSGFDPGMRGAYQGMHGNAGAGYAHARGHSVFVFLGILLTVLLMVVWLVVGILVIVLLARKLRKEKAP